MYCPSRFFVFYAKQKINLTWPHEALEQLENLDVSSEDDFWQWEFHLKKKISPPNNEGDKDIDEDSGDENELLPKNQTEVKF